MKTLTKILREIFSANNAGDNKVNSNQVAEPQDSKTGDNINNNSNHIECDNETKTENEIPSTDENIENPNQKPQQDERETYENPGNSGLDNPDAGQTGGLSKPEEESFREESHTEEAGNGDARGDDSGESEAGRKESGDSDGDRGNLTTSVETSVAESEEKRDVKELRDLPEVKAMLEEAYNNGVIAGKNAQIEKRYFPKENDGIPHFHGNPSKATFGIDIFSMAREA